MLRPSLQDVLDIAERDEGNLVPIYREVPADLETPVSAYLKMAEAPYSFLLESVEGGERLARYSFIGTNPHRVLRSGPNESWKGDPLVPLENELSPIRYVPMPNLPALTGGAIGYVSYDAVRHWEPKMERPQADPLELPESMFLLCDSMVIFDHIHHTMKVVAHVRLDGDVAASYRRAADQIDEIASRLRDRLVPLPEDNLEAVIRGNSQGQSNVGREGYELMVEKLREHIIAGDVIQAVPSHRVARPTGVHPFNIYRQLRTVNPSPYMFYLDMGGFQIVGASPELLVRVEDGKVVNHPIAGTRRRGATQEEDDALADELLNDEKERAEHIMLVDLGRNDVGRVAKPGTVKVDQLMGIERYSHVMHIVSQVSGELRDDRTPYDAFRSVFPAGTLSGAPKVRAMELIAEMEPERRYVYGGSVGYASFAGTLDTCIGIRTFVFKDGVAYLHAGGGIVFDSEPEAEYMETVHKMNALNRAIDQAEIAAAETPQGSLGYG